MKLFVVMEMKKGTIHVGSRGWFSARPSFWIFFLTNKVYVVSCFSITTNNFISGVISLGNFPASIFVFGYFWNQKILLCFKLWLVFPLVAGLWGVCQTYLFLCKEYPIWFGICCSHVSKVKFFTSFANFQNLVSHIDSVIAPVSFTFEGRFTIHFNRNYVEKK